jgi:tetratricopeptide (TPR) repeat protein
VLDNFAKGLAYINAKDLKSAKSCLDNIENNLADSLLAVRIMPFNAPITSCKVAASVLKGSLLFAAGKTGESITVFKEAIAEEDKLVYREPQDWIIPARQYIGAYLLKLHKPKDAERYYKEDLVSNPENGWSLLGMYNSMLAQNRNSEAARYKSRYLVAFKSADVKPVASVF